MLSQKPTHKTPLGASDVNVRSVDLPGINELRLHMTVLIGPSMFHLSNASHGTPIVNTARNIIHCSQPQRHNQSNNPSMRPWDCFLWA